MSRVAMKIVLCFVFISCPIITAGYFMSSSTDTSHSASFEAKGLPLVFLNTADSTNTH